NVIIFAKDTKYFKYLDSSLEDSLEELIFIVAFILNPYIIAIAVSKYLTLSLDMLFHYYSKYIL
ncbi:hypothetical protein, partial [Francisella tularensis]|uniref:hypothetical protein n=1 Tax=Francisella tularensis TaxID=263 RepID=UPI001F2D7FB8